MSGGLIDSQRLMRLAELADADRDPFVKQAILSAATGNTKLVNALAPQLHLRAVQKQLAGVPFHTPQTAEILAGIDPKDAALLGLVIDGETPFLYPYNLLNQHGFIGGGTGTGKTNTLYGIVLQVMRNHCPVWIFDRDKIDYRHLVQMAPGLLVLNCENFRFNPLEVLTGVKPEDQLTAFVTVLSKSAGLLQGSESLLLRACHELYQLHGVFDGKDTFPTPYDLRDRIAGYKFNRYSRSAGFQDSIVNRLDAMLMSAPSVYDCATGFSIPDLAERSIVLEIRGLSEWHARCLINWLLFWLFMCRIANNQRGNVLRNLVVIDEAKYVVPPGFNENIGFVPIASILAQSREAGLGVLIADQTAHLDESVFVQTRLKLCMRLGSGADIERIRKALALSKEEAAYIPKLGVGQAIVRVPQVDPFLIRIPRVRLG